MVDLAEIEKTLRYYYKIRARYAIREDGTVDVEGNVKMRRKRADLGITFGRVKGNFVVVGQGLKSLKGSPQRVGGNFLCSVNNLTTLEGAPQIVGGGFVCSYNRLTNLQGSPQRVGGAFACTNNKLESLKGMPPRIGHDMWCTYNQLTNLVGSPTHIPGIFCFHSNPLATLNGMPASIDDSVMLDWTKNLPLLQCLNAKEGVVLLNAPSGLEKILNDDRWKGQGRRGAMRCIAALVEAGFEGNAKW